MKNDRIRKTTLGGAIAAVALGSMSGSAPETSGAERATALEALKMPTFYAYATGVPKPAYRKKRSQAGQRRRARRARSNGGRA